MSLLRQSVRDSFQFDQHISMLITANTSSDLVDDYHNIPVCTCTGTHYCCVLYHTGLLIKVISCLFQIVKESYPDHTAFDKKDPHYDK